MNISRILLCSFVLVLTIASNPILIAQQNASEADKTFLGKISQDNLYALEASEAALHQADSDDVKDIAWTEQRDHEKIGRELKTLSAASNVPAAKTLNSDLQQRLERLKASSGRDFDNAYLKEMAILEAEQEKLLAQETTGGTTADCKAFASKTGAIVQRHLDTLSQSAPQN